MPTGVKTDTESCHAAANSQQDIEWMDSLGGDIELYHYQSHHSNRPHYFPPGGNEAGAYLQYIIDYYDCLPEVSCKRPPSSCLALILCPTLEQEIIQCLARSLANRAQRDLLPMTSCSTSALIMC